MGGKVIDKELRKAIGARIRAARVLKYSNAQPVADHFGISIKGVLHWENGAAMPSADQLHRLSIFLDTSPDALLGTSSWPFDLFTPSEFALIPESDRDKLENEIAGMVQRAKRRGPPEDRTGKPLGGSSGLSGGPRTGTDD